MGDTSREDEWIEWGKIGRPHGLRGELRLFLHFAESEHLGDVQEVRVRTAETTSIQKIASLRPGPKGAIVAFEGVRDRNAADRLKNAVVDVRASLFPPAEHDDDEFYAFELEGLDAVDAEGKRIGIVDGIVDFGAGELLALRRGPDVTFLPFAEPYVGAVDLDAGTVVVDPGEFDT